MGYIVGLFDYVGFTFKHFLIYFLIELRALTCMRIDFGKQLGVSII